MNDEHLNAPVLFLVFNRPETTLRVFQKIRNARPSRLYVAADGPRLGVTDEAKRCKKVRDISTEIDWDCDVQTRFLTENHGCKVAVSSAIDWFFEQEEMGIILEDDCLPDLSFFRFCEEMLFQYCEDDRVMMISGDNFDRNAAVGGGYGFTSYPQIWGWATWRRAWKNYDLTMSSWPQFRESKSFREMFNTREFRCWRNVFDRTYESRINSWDYAWVLCCFVNNGLSIFPSLNLVSNIGCLSDGTHTNKFLDPCMGLPFSSIEFPLEHPVEVIINEKYDALVRGVQNPNMLTWFVRVLRYIVYAFFHKETSLAKVLREVCGKVKGCLPYDVKHRDSSG